MLLTAILISCKESNTEKLKETFEIDKQYISQEIGSASSILSIPIKTTLSTKEWQVKCAETWLTLFQENNNLKISVQENYSKTKRTAHIAVISKVNRYSISLTQYGAEELVLVEDKQVIPYGGKASSYQPGQDIDKSYDGKFTTASEASHYHSSWSNTQFPVTLEYYFRGDEEINYFIYYTRSGNGNFGRVKVYTATDGGRNDYTLQGSYDFKEQSTPSKVSFTAPIKATGVKFVVESGLGGYASCDEMQFFQKREDPLNAKLASVFTDMSCSEVKSGATAEQIETLPTLFKRLARSLKENTYPADEKRFRIQTYKAYSSPEYWATKLKTNRYSHLNNPTGIITNKNEEIIVLVSGLGQRTASLKCVPDLGVNGEEKILEEGVNKISFSIGGNLFIVYEDIDPRQLPDIKVHFPPQQGSGGEHALVGFNFWDLEVDQTDNKYLEYLSKARAPQGSDCIFILKGRKSMFTALKQMLQTQQNTKGYGVKSGMERWDNLIIWEQELCGIDDFSATGEFNSLMHITTHKEGLYATQYHINMAGGNPNEKDGWGFKNSFDPRDMDREQDREWGPGHELGHMHQGAINWASTTESSNNLFSNYIVYKIDKWGSRGSSLETLAKYRFAPATPWVRFKHPRNSMGEFIPFDMAEGDDNKNGLYQGEDSEMHMRLNQQLWTYFDRIAGKKGTIKKIFQQGRTAEFDLSSVNPGQAQLMYARNVAKAANMDMTEFFDAWGFFIPVQKFTLRAYGQHSYEVTQQMINETKEYMKQFQTKCPPIQYIEDRKYVAGSSGNQMGISEHGGDVGYFSTYRDKIQITKSIKYSISGRRYTITDGEQAVAFELRKDNRIIWFANRFTFEVPTNVDISGTEVYAVQYDGKRIMMHKQ